MKMKIAICDNDKFFIDNIRKELAKCIKEEPGLKATVDEFLDENEFLNKFSEEYYELVYLDIELNSANGIEVAHKIHEMKPDCIIIFVTGYMDYVSKSFLENAFQYIHKPLDSEFFQSEFKRAVLAVQVNKTTAMFSTDKGTIVFYLSEIYYIQTLYKDYILYTSRGVFKGPIKSIRKIKIALLNYDFYRIQRSYIINMNHIMKFDNEIVTMRDGAQLPVSKKKLVQFKKLLLSKRIS